MDFTSEIVSWFIIPCILISIAENYFMARPKEVMNIERIHS